VCARIVTWFFEFPWDMEAFLMPNSKPMGILDAGAAACQPSHPSLCLRARVFRSKTSTYAASPASLCFSWPFPARRRRRGSSRPSRPSGETPPPTPRHLRFLCFLVFRGHSPTRHSRHGHAPIPSSLHGHKNSQLKKPPGPPSFFFISFLPETRRHGGVQGGAWQ
jgi:hypothetical protein